MKLEEVIQESITLVTKGQTVNAIKNLRNEVQDQDLQNNLDLLHSRYSCILVHYKSGFFTTDEYLTNLNKVNSSLLSILYENKPASVKTTGQDILIDKVKSAKEQYDYKLNLSEFMSSEGGIKQTMKVVNEFFSTMPEKVESVSNSSGLRMRYLTSPKYQFEGIINFESKASIYLYWLFKNEHSLQDTKLKFVLLDQISTFDHAVAVGFQKAKEIKAVEFEPTADKSMKIKWKSSKLRFLDIEDVQMQCFDLIAYYLDENSK